MPPTRRTPPADPPVGLRLTFRSAVAQLAASRDPRARELARFLARHASLFACRLGEWSGREGDGPAYYANRADRDDLLQSLLLGAVEVLRDRPAGDLVAAWRVCDRRLQGEGRRQRAWRARWRGRPLPADADPGRAGLDLAPEEVEEDDLAAAVHAQGSALAAVERGDLRPLASLGDLAERVAAASEES
jgi:hypothetical protein